MNLSGCAAGGGRWAGMTELHVAAFLGDEKAATGLVAAGADIEARSRYDYSTMPQVHEFLNNDKERKRLIEEGVSMEARMRTGATPLMMAAGHRDSRAALQLIALGANVSAVEKDGNTALHYAAEVGSVPLCRALMKAGAHPDLARSFYGSDGARPLHLAAKRGHAEVCALLLAAGAEWHSMDLNSSPLHRAAEGGHLEACRALVSHGADPNYRKPLGTKKEMFRSPLSAAMKYDHVEVVRYFLLECGADPQDKTAAGLTLERIARLKGRFEIVRLIEELSHCASTIEAVSAAVSATASDETSKRRIDRSMSPL